MHLSNLPIPNFLYSSVVMMGKGEANNFKRSITLYELSFILGLGYGNLLLDVALDARFHINRNNFHSYYYIV